MKELLLNQTKPIDDESGFSMPGYFVWGGSIRKDNGRFWMLASRWPRTARRRGANILDGYRTSSEIVLASSDIATGPYRYESTIIEKRERTFWDSEMAHNPYLIPYAQKFVLFYIGSRIGDIRRKIGYAVADSIQGPYLRSENEIPLTDDANNPAPFETSDGGIGLMFRDRDLNVFSAASRGLNSPFSIVNRNIFAGTRLEDFCIYRWNGFYHMICEDNRGEAGGHWRWGVHYLSEDGLRNWTRAKRFTVYDHTVELSGGRSLTLERRERPQLIIDDMGNITHLVTSALKDRESRCLVVPVAISGEE